MHYYEYLAEQWIIMISTLLIHYKRECKSTTLLYEQTTKQKKIYCTNSLNTKLDYSNNSIYNS